MVLHLRKSLSGLKQSSHIWYATFKEFVISIGFVESRVDRGLFVYEDQSIVIAAVILHIDDPLITANEGLIG